MFEYKIVFLWAIATLFAQTLFSSVPLPDKKIRVKLFKKTVEEIERLDGEGL